HCSDTRSLQDHLSVFSGVVDSKHLGRPRKLHTRIRLNTEQRSSASLEVPCAESFE
ncbi:hypothetical protein WG66_012922, partial [Moniliophthora roreri]